MRWVRPSMTARIAAAEDRVAGYCDDAQRRPWAGDSNSGLRVEDVAAIMNPGEARERPIQALVNPIS
ncbi:MAG: hypothetical protein ACRD21_14030, partial [Vicinamibacteria bacterium]